MPREVISLTEKLKNRLMRDYSICLVTYPSFTVHEGYVVDIHKGYRQGYTQAKVVGETELTTVVKAYKWVLGNSSIL